MSETNDQDLNSIPTNYQNLLNGYSSNPLGETALSDPGVSENSIVDRLNPYVEADDPRIALFAACLGINMINIFLAGKPGENDNSLILQFAKLLEDNPEIKSDIGKLAGGLYHSVENINRVISQVWGSTVLADK